MKTAAEYGLNLGLKSASETSVEAPARKLNRTLSTRFTLSSDPSLEEAGKRWLPGKGRTMTNAQKTPVPQLLMYVLQPSPRIVSFLESVRQQACENGLELLTFDFHGEEGRRRFLELLTDPARREAFMKIYDLYVPTAGYAVEKPEPWPVNLDFTARHLRVGTSVTTLEPLLLAIYAGFLSNKRSCSETSCRAEHGDCAFRCFLSIADMCRNGFPHRVAEFYRRSYGWGGQREEDMLARLENGLETEAMRQYISKINRRLRASLCDHPMLDRLLIVPIGRYGNTRYGVRLPRHAVPKE